MKDYKLKQRNLRASHTLGEVHDVNKRKQKTLKIRTVFRHECLHDLIMHKKDVRKRA